MLSRVVGDLAKYVSAAEIWKVGERVIKKRMTFGRRVPGTEPLEPVDPGCTVPFEAPLRYRYAEAAAISFARATGAGHVWFDPNQVRRHEHALPPAAEPRDSRVWQSLRNR